MAAAKGPGRLDNPEAGQRTIRRTREAGGGCDGPCRDFHQSDGCRHRQTAYRRRRYCRRGALTGRGTGFGPPRCFEITIQVARDLSSVIDSTLKYSADKRD